MSKAIVYVIVSTVLIAGSVAIGAYRTPADNVGIIGWLTTFFSGSVFFGLPTLLLQVAIAIALFRLKRMRCALFLSITVIEIIVAIFTGYSLLSNSGP